MKKADREAEALYDQLFGEREEGEAKPVPKFKHSNKVDAPIELEIEDEPQPSFDETCDLIIDEMRVISREEWFEIARTQRSVGAGFSPMNQLQTKIRRSPLTFPPFLIGVFKEPKGTVFERVLNWFRPKGWEVQPDHSARGGWPSKWGVDLQPWNKIDPIMDEWDELEKKYDPTSFKIRAVVRKLLDLCYEEKVQQDFNTATIISKARPNRKRWPGYRLLDVRGKTNDYPG